MDIKLSISILISSAYFLTLFAFKTLKSGDILKVLFASGLHSLIVFILIYILILYIDFSLEGLKKQDTKNTLDSIRRLEEKYREKEKEELDKKFKRLQEMESEKGREKSNMSDLDTMINNTNQDEFKEQNAQDIEKLKQDAGTQFDTNFIKKYDIPEI